MKRNGKSLLSLLALGFLLSCTQTPEKALHSSTVRLVMKDTDGEHLGWGSGFFVTHNEIVTHLHVVAGATNVDAELVDKKKKYTIEGVTAFDVKNKLVILKVAGKGRRPLSLGNSQEVPEDVSVYGLGYPGGGKGRTIRYTVLLNSTSMNFEPLIWLTTKIYQENSRDSVRKWFEKLTSFVEFYSGEYVELIPENSGGAVLNEEGKVIGIAVSGTKTDVLETIAGEHIQEIAPDGTVNYAIPSNALKALLAKSREAEPLAEWREKAPIRPVAMIQLAKTKGRGATVQLFKEDTKGQRISIGSGFFVRHNQIATNIHVVANAKQVFAKLVQTDMWYTIEKVTAFDTKNDLVILTTIEEDAKHLSLGDSDTVRIGDPIAAVGAPISGSLAFSGVGEVEEGKITEGTIHRIQDSNKWLQLKAQVSPGNSGGPVLNSTGEVIGICALANSSNITYAIPSSALEVLLTRPESVESLAQWRMRKPIRAYDYLSQGTSKFRIMQTINAIQDHKMIEKILLGLPEVDDLRGRVNIDQYQAAMQDCDKAIQLYPDFAMAYALRARVNIELGQYQAAIQDCDKTIELIPDFAGAYYSRGNAMLGLSKEAPGKREASLHEAIKDFNKAIELDSEFTDASLGRRIAIWSLSEKVPGKREAASLHKAIKDLNIKLRRDSILATWREFDYYYTRGNAKYILGLSEEVLGKREAAQSLYEAIKDFNKAIELNPDFASTYYKKGLAYEALGQQEAAKADFKKAKELNPNLGK